MAQLKAARVADVPTLDVVAPGLVEVSSPATAKQRGGGTRFSVIGHRGKGMNALASPDRRLQEVRENTVRSLNAAARFPVDYVEFDVQVISTMATRSSDFSGYQSLAFSVVLVTGRLLIEVVVIRTKRHGVGWVLVLLCYFPAYRSAAPTSR
jgi:hypothetical protein